MSGRVDWTNAISHTFGAAAMRLFAVPKHLGELIGCAARIYAAYPTKFDPGSWKETLRHKGRFGAESSGRAFVDLALRSLPELGSSQSSMRAAVELSYKDAILGFEKAFVMMKELCGCRKHCLKSSISSEDGENKSDGERKTTGGSQVRSIAECDRSDEKCFYIPLLAVTIIQLVRQLSTVGDMPSDLCPKRRGIQGIYEVVEIEADTPASGPKTVSSDFTHLLEITNTRDLLSLAALVFTAYDDPLDSYDYLHHDDMSARAISGLCFVLDPILQLSDQLENLLRVHIIPGGIEFKGRPYTVVRDGMVTPPLSILKPLVLPAPSTRYKTQMGLLNDLTARAIVTEAADCLRMTYEIKTTSGTCFLAPKDLSVNMNYTASPISCRGKQCRPFKGLSDHFLYTLSPSRLPYFDYGTGRTVPIDQPEKPNICLFGNNAIACCVALNRFEETKVLLQGDECISCCARRAMMLEESEHVVIVSGLTVERLQRLLGDSIALIT